MRAWIIVDGVATSLSDGSLCRLEGWDGLGLADIHRLASRGPLQQGDTDEGYRRDPRFPTLTLGVVGSTPAEMAARRATLMGLLKPGSSAAILEFEREDGVTRRIDVQYSGGANAPSANKRPVYHRVGAVFKAPDPTFYDETGEAVTFAVSGGGDGLQIPMEVPFGVGSDVIDQSTPVTYTGTAETYPFIRVVGPVDDVVITNQTSGAKLDFTGVSIDPGDYRDIDLGWGRKTVVDSLGANKVSELTDDSDLTSFCLLPAPDAPSGINALHVGGSNATGATAITLQYFNRYASLL